jgi:hypothetical protein
MTEFTETALRHYCRNPKCGSKLPKPASSEREAFCARGCHTAFYRKRCLVCEGPIERSRDDQKICRKAQCRRAWRARTGFGRYLAPSDAKLPSKKPVNKGAKGAPKRDPRSISWRVVAGPPGGISANAYHCAIVGADELLGRFSRPSLRTECAALFQEEVNRGPNSTVWGQD